MRKIEVRLSKGVRWFVPVDQPMSIEQAVREYGQARYVGGVLEHFSTTTEEWVALPSDVQKFMPEERAANQGRSVDVYRLRPYNDAPYRCDHAKTQGDGHMRVCLACGLQWVDAAASGALQAERQKREGDRPVRSAEAELAAARANLEGLRLEHASLTTKFRALSASRSYAASKADERQVSDDEYNRALVQNAKMRIEIEDLKRKLGKVKR